jgi:hypothetical protein
VQHASTPANLSANAHVSLREERYCLWASRSPSGGGFPYSGGVPGGKVQVPEMTYPNSMPRVHYGSTVGEGTGFHGFAAA